MKKLLLVLILFSVSMCSFSQSNDGNFSKEIRKEAKQYQKEGWKVYPGSASLENQLEQWHLMKSEKINDGSLPKYIFGFGTASNKSMDSAERMAINYAKQELATQVTTEVERVFTTENEEVIIIDENGERIEFNTKTTDISKFSTNHRLGRTIEIIKIYRSNPNHEGETEVAVRIACDFAKELMKVAEE